MRDGQIALFVMLTRVADGTNMDLTSSDLPEAEETVIVKSEAGSSSTAVSGTAVPPPGNGPESSTDAADPSSSLSLAVFDDKGSVSLPGELGVLPVISTAGTPPAASSVLPAASSVLPDAEESSQSSGVSLTSEHATSALEKMRTESFGGNVLDPDSDEMGENPPKVPKLSRSQTSRGTTDAATEETKIKVEEQSSRGGIMAGRPGRSMPAASSKLFKKKEETVVKKEH